MSNNLTKSNITFLIAIIGLIISLINLSYFFISRKRKLTINFDAYGVKPHYDKNNLLLVHYRFDNNSQLSISFTRIQVILNHQRYDCSIRKLIAEEFRRTNAGKVTYEDITTTDILPINIAPLASHSGFLGFVIPQDIRLINETALTFRICTNRGKAIQKTFELFEDVQVH